MATKTTTKTTNHKAKDAAKASAKGAADKKLGALDAAARVLKETKKAMNCSDLVEQMAAKGFWSSPGGKTPHATLHAAISREIKVKGRESRFKKTGPGTFASKS